MDLALLQRDDVGQRVSITGDQIKAVRLVQYWKDVRKHNGGGSADAIIITGTLSIHSTPRVVLFDSGSATTFLPRAFVDRFGVLIDDLGHDLIMSTPTGATLTTKLCGRGIPIVIQHHTFPTDFVVLSMRKFDAIFNMDWMTRHKAIINCLKKKVQLCLSCHERVTF